jgi:hypothetical protein
MRAIFVNGLMLMILFSLSSCATKASFLTSSIVPAATGDVTVNSDKNNNYVIQIKLAGLAEAERLQPSKQTYVVWLETDHSAAKNLGQITISNLKASFETVSSFKPIRIFITAENDAAITYPGTQVVLTTDRF